MWVGCSGSLIPNLLLGDNSAGIEAATGTVAHSVAETWLVDGVRPSHLLGEVMEVDGFSISIDEEMLEFVEMYVDWCAFLPGDHYVETKVDISDLTPIADQKGTADHAACTKGKLVISDLKFGKGVPVYAKENTQGLLYAWGFFKKYDKKYHFEEITIRICQPRRYHYDEWTITTQELYKWAAYIKERALAAWCHGAERTPGEKQCQWCRVKKDCSAYLTWFDRMIDGYFEDLDKPVTIEDMRESGKRLDTGGIQPIDPTTLTLAQKAKIYGYKSAVEKWFKAIGADLSRAVAEGYTNLGWKFVEGRANRSFIGDENAVVESLMFVALDEDEIRPRTLLSPAKIEEALIAKGIKRKMLPIFMEGLTTKPRGKPTLVRDSDKRPAITLNDDNYFDDQNDEFGEDL